MPGTHTAGPVLGPRALNRATLARQMLLERAAVPALDAVEHLVGLQAQAPFSPYYGLWSRLAGFVPDELAQLLLDRRAVRIVVMRGTIHLLSAADARYLRPLVQPLMDRDLGTNSQHGRALVGVDRPALADRARRLLEERPLTSAELGRLLAEDWPDHHPRSLAHAARNLLALVQVPPRAVWGRSGQARLAPLETWIGQPLVPEPSLDGMVVRYLAAFGPASVADIQTWSGLTRLRAVVDRLRPDLLPFRSEDGKELFDLPDAPRPGPEVPAPVRFLPDFDNLLRSHADRTRVISDTDRRLIATRNGVSPHTVLVDGTFAGTWAVREGTGPDKGTATLSVALSRPIGTDDRDQLVAEGRDLLAFAAAGADDHRVEVMQRSPVP